MEVARQRAAAGAPEGHVVVADAQTAGRGRRGRSWHSPPGAGLWCTVLLRPAGERIETLGLVAGAAVLEALHALGATDARLKWPNDILVHRRKLCGILLAAEGQVPKTPVVLLGIGVNLGAATAVDLPAEIGALYVGLDEVVAEPVAADAVLAALLASFAQHYSRWSQIGLDSALEWWRRFDVLRGNRVTAEGPEGPVVGVADGLDPSGALRVRRDAGDIVLVRAGEVQRVR